MSFKKVLAEPNQKRGGQGSRIYRADPAKKKFVAITGWKKVE